MCRHEICYTHTINNLCKRYFKMLMATRQTSTVVVEKVQELAMKGVKADQRECLIDNEPM